MSGMSPKNQNLLQRIIEQRAKRLGVDEEDLRRNAARKPQFLEAAEGQAANQRAGSTQRILREDLSRLARCEYPTPECVMPYEIDEIQEHGLTGLTTGRLNHVRECSFCTTLLAVLEPTETKLQDFLRVSHRVGADAVPR